MRRSLPPCARCSSSKLHGAQFGLTDSLQLRVLAVPPADSLGVEHVKFQQVHHGVPVRGGEFIVHLRGARAMVANGHVTNESPRECRAWDHGQRRPR